MLATFGAGLSCSVTISLSCCSSRFLWPFGFFRNSLSHELLITIDAVVIRRIVLKTTASAKTKLFLLFFHSTLSGILIILWLGKQLFLAFLTGVPTERVEVLARGVWTGDSRLRGRFERRHGIWLCIFFARLFAYFAGCHQFEVVEEAFRASPFLEAAFLLKGIAHTIYFD